MNSRMLDTGYGKQINWYSIVGFKIFLPEYCLLKGEKFNEARSGSFPFLLFLHFLKAKNSGYPPYNFQPK